MAGLIELLEQVGKGGIQKGFRNYHGSPHKFDRFDIGKIGTGEGNQTFGWGLYTADSEDVAKAYRNQLKSKLDTYSHPVFGTVPKSKVEAYLASVGQKIDPKRYGDLKARSTAQFILGHDMPIEQQIKDASKGVYPDQKGWLGMLDEAQRFKKNPNEGALYEVEIGANPQQDFLYHERPFAAQPGVVQEALKDLRVDPIKSFKRSKYAPPGSEGLLDSGRISYRQLANNKGSEKAASEALAERGVKGIRYLDQASRGTGINTYNTIVFSDKLISIVRKYGVAALVGQGLISSELGEQLKAQGIDKGT